MPVSRNPVSPPSVRPRRTARIVRHGLRALLVGCLLMLPAWMAHATERVPLYTYYSDPPYAVNGPDSLTVRLADWLTHKAEGRYRFEAIELPRRRLERVIAQPGWAGAVAWANPVWLDDRQQTRFGWTIAYAHEADLVVSRRDQPVEFDGIASLHGFRVGAVLGRRHDELRPGIQAGLIAREDAAREAHNLLKVKQGRVDVTYIQASSLPHYRRIYPDLDDWLYVAPKPRAVFERHLAVARGNGALLQFLNRALADFARDPAWQALAHPGFPPP